jgi:hypothetical protein
MINLNKDELRRLNIPTTIAPDCGIMIWEPRNTHATNLIQLEKISVNEAYDFHGYCVAQIVKAVAGNKVKLYYTTNFDQNTLDFCKQNNIRIVNASMTTMQTTDKDEILKEFYEWGGILCAAAGNKEGSRVHYPGRSPYTIAVSATNTPDCNGTEIDITADSWWKVYLPSGGLHSFDGTSAATPVITGCIAYILDVYPEWTMDKVKEFLQTNSTPGNEPYERVFSFPDDFGEVKEVPKEYIILHHSATPDGLVLKDFDAIKRYHMEVNGWRDIGYHWVVERIDGVLTAIPGRPEADDGAHCLRHNSDAIGVCVVGDYTKAPPDDETYRFVAALCKQIKTRHPIKEVGGHRDYYATACPGDKFDVEKVRQYVKGEEIVNDIKGRWSEESINLVVKSGLMKGYPDGSFKPEQPVTREELATVLARLIKEGVPTA